MDNIPQKAMRLPIGSEGKSHLYRRKRKSTAVEARTSLPFQGQARRSQMEKDVSKQIGLARRIA
jgi:hypothetical protein